MLQLTTSSQRTSIVIDTLDECNAVHQFRLFDSLKEVLEKSSNAQILVTGGPHLLAEADGHLPGRVTSMFVGPTSDNIVRSLRARLSEGETLDAIDLSLEEETMEKIPASISEMCPAAMVLRIFSHIIG